MLIHCIWVVGKAKEKGYGSKLLDACVEDAKQAKMNGVAMVTSSGYWLAGNKLLLKHGFDSVEKAPPTFDLMVKKFKNSPSPSLPTNWEERLSRCGLGLTIFRANQCPYLDYGINEGLATADEMGLKARVIELNSRQEVQEQSPSAYGIFNMVYNGKLLSYHFRMKSELLRLLK